MKNPAFWGSFLHASGPTTALVNFSVILVLNWQMEEGIHFVQRILPVISWIV